MNEPQDSFLSEEDLDLRQLTDEELIEYWNLWLLQAQATNDDDAAAYEHGVFERDPAPRAWPAGTGASQVTVDHGAAGEPSSPPAQPL